MRRRRTPSVRAREAFMLRVGQVGRSARRRRCEHTLPLFALVLILDADGTLAPAARGLAAMVRA